jgi:hypothetical protein
MSFTEASDSEHSTVENKKEYHDPLAVEQKFYFHPYADR